MTQSRASHESASLEGQLTRVLYESPDQRFVVAKLLEDHADVEVTIIGHLSGLIPGEKVRLKGEWKQHPRFGRQFAAHIVETIAPTSTAGLRRYLESGAIRGIGAKTAEKLVDHFGESLGHVLDHEPDRIHEIEGLGKAKISTIIESWRERKETREIFVFLHGHGLGTMMAARVYETYGAGSIEVVKQSPFRLAKEIRGIGFLISDRIAKTLGWEPDKPQRLRAALHYVLDQSGQNGHMCLPLDVLVEKAVAYLGVDEPKVRVEIQNEINDGELIAEVTPTHRITCYRPVQRDAEVEFAERLISLRNNPQTLETLHADNAALAVKRAELESELELSVGQRDALVHALTEKVSVLTGGPGVGKTTIIRLLVAILRKYGIDFCLAAPTGRAAKRLSTTAGAKGSTIHRLLYFDPDSGEFKFGITKKLKAKFVIVDEVSMMDQGIALALLRAIDSESYLLLVGDADQLPSVGAGNILKDIIESNAVFVSRLKAIFRQSEENPIVDAAHAILEGRVPKSDVRDGQGLAIIEETNENITERIVKLVADQIPDRLEVSHQDIQVLSPMIKAPSGTAALNQLLQKTINPRKSASERPLPFHPGDRVMQIRNNYTLKVFNGDLGEVTHAVFDDKNQPEITVSLDDGPITYRNEHLEELLLAYAITIHRSQGCEFPVVVIPMTTQHRIMLKRNLIYTAITRAKRLVVLVGSLRAIEIAVSDNELAERHTGLAWRLARLGHHDKETL